MDSYVIAPFSEGACLIWNLAEGCVTSAHPIIFTFYLLLLLLRSVGGGTVTDPLSLSLFFYHTHRVQIYTKLMALEQVQMKFEA